MKDPRPSTENVQVFLRMRPPNEKEKDSNEVNLWAIGRNYVRLNMDRFNTLIKQHRMNFAPYARPCVFNYCFGPDSNNNMIYNKMMRTLVDGSLSGINGTVFMYGQTGSGKTFTMMGDYNGEMTRSQTKRNKTPMRCSTINATPKLTERPRTPIMKMKEITSGRTSQPKNPEEREELTAALFGLAFYNRGSRR